MRLVEGEFPDYRGVIPKQSKYKISVEARRAARRQSSAPRFSPTSAITASSGRSPAGTLTVSSTSPEMGEASESIDVDFNGEEFSIGFNAAYCMQALGVMPQESDRRSWASATRSAPV